MINFNFVWLLNMMMQGFVSAIKTHNCVVLYLILSYIDEKGAINGSYSITNVEILGLIRKKLITT